MKHQMKLITYVRNELFILRHIGYSQWNIEPPHSPIPQTKINQC